MSTSVTLNGVSYTIPAVGDALWGTNVSNYLIAISTATLQKSGGAFTLAADVDFGSSFGLLAPYFKSKSSTIAAAGILRLAVGNTVNWRNNANSADLVLGINGSDKLTFAGSTVVFSGLIVNADIAAGAAIAYSKLNLSGSVVDADVSSSAAIAYSKLNLTGSIQVADLNSGSFVLTTDLGGTGISAGGSPVYPGSGTILTDQNTVTVENKTFDGSDTISGTVVISIQVQGGSGNKSLSMPYPVGVSGALVGNDTAQTLTGKNMDYNSNTFTNFPAPTNTPLIATTTAQTMPTGQICSPAAITAATSPTYVTAAQSGGGTNNSTGLTTLTFSATGYYRVTCQIKIQYNTGNPVYDYGCTWGGTATIVNPNSISRDGGTIASGADDFTYLAERLVHVTATSQTVTMNVKYSGTTSNNTGSTMITACPI